MTNAAFFVYLSASCVGVAIVALLLLIFRVQSDRRQSKNMLMAFVIVTFLVGLLYFVERFYTGDFEVRGGWSVIVRVLDLLLTDAQLLFWCRFLQTETDTREGWIRRGSDIFIVAAFLVQLCISLFLMDEHYYIASAGGRAFATAAYAAFMALGTVLLAGHAFLAGRREADPRARGFHIGISLLLLLDLLGGSFYMTMLFRSSPLLDAGLYAAYDFVSVSFLLINILTAVYIYRCEIGGMIEIAAAPAGQEERQEEKARTLQERFAQEGLSQRETEVALLLLEGASYDDIADRLIISKYTVKRHAHNIYQKLEVSSKVDLISRFR